MDEECGGPFEVMKHQLVLEENDRPGQGTIRDCEKQEEEVLRHGGRRQLEQQQHK